MRVLLMLVMIAAATLPPTVQKAAAATCLPNIGPGIAAPVALPTKLPGFHAAWYGQSGYMRLCPGGTAQATLAYYNAGSLGVFAGRRAQGAFLGAWARERGSDGACLRV